MELRDYPQQEKWPFILQGKSTMTHKPPPSKKERKDGENRLDNKRLRKREQRLQERLQKAQAEQARALERLEQAQLRLQKRVTEVQLLEERLAQTHKQQEPALAPPIE